MEWLYILPIALLAGTIGGVIGFGSGVIMVPILAFTFGAKAAVPIMAIAAILANGSRVTAWWRELDLPAALIYCATAVPAAFFGASLFLNLNVHAVEMALGVFLIAVVPARHALRRSKLKIKRWHLSIVGAVMGFLTGIVASTGPINAPFFLAYGLTKGAYLATEAFGSAAVSITKITTFSLRGVVSFDNVMRGLGVGSGLMAGSYLAKAIVAKLKPADFEYIMDGVVLIAGVVMLVAALRGV
jgi:uncharacterized protein